MDIWFPALSFTSQLVNISNLYSPCSYIVYVQVRVCDSFFIEGFKVLFRVGLAILTHFCKDYQCIGMISLYGVFSLHAM